jgi:hypothetical protein
MEQVMATLHYGNDRKRKVSKAPEPTIRKLLEAERKAAAEEARVSETDDIWCGNPYSIAALKEFPIVADLPEHVARAQVLALLAVAYEVNQLAAKLAPD